MDEGSSFVMADIPGLIEGAGEGAGLGHEFLRHVDRCRLLVHVIDVSGSEGRDPIEDFEKINHELVVFSPELAERKQIVVANKCDLTEDEEVARIGEWFTSRGYDFFPVMAAIAEGTDKLINHIASELAKLPPIIRYEPEEREEIITFTGSKRNFTVRKEGAAFLIEDAEWLLKILETVDPDDYESLQYFQRVMKDTGIIQALIDAGVHDGDTVKLYDIEFDYIS